VGVLIRAVREQDTVRCIKLKYWRCIKPHWLHYSGKVLHDMSGLVSPISWVVSKNLVTTYGNVS